MNKLIFTLFLSCNLIVLYGQDDYYMSNYNSNNDSLNTTSIIGNYLSFGLGNGSANHKQGMGLFLNYSFAIKSHTITFSAGGVTRGKDSYQTSYSSGYIGLLFGESIRRKIYMFSLSIGAGNSKVVCYLTDTNSTQNNKKTIFSRHGTSFLAEIKLYIYLSNKIGVGYSHTIDYTSKLTANYNTFSIVYLLSKKYKFD